MILLLDFSLKNHKVVSALSGLTGVGYVPANVPCILILGLLVLEYLESEESDCSEFSYFEEMPACLSSMLR